MPGLILVTSFKTLFVYIFQDAVQGVLDIGMEGNVGNKHLFKLVGIVVDLHDAFVFKKFIVPEVTGSFIKPGTQKNHQIGLFNDIFVGAAARSDTQAAKREFRPFTDGAFPLQAGSHRDAHCLAELRKGVLSAGTNSAIARYHYREIGFRDKP